MLFIWRWRVHGLDFLAGVFLVLFGVFLFYSLNYRTLVLRLNAESLRLKFGLFTWAVPLEDISECRLDALPAVMNYDGAGIHFMNIRGRYRISFNFLEYPRVVLAMREKRGWVRDVSFST